MLLQKSGISQKPSPHFCVVITGGCSSHENGPAFWCWSTGAAGVFTQKHKCSTEHQTQSTILRDDPVTAEACLVSPCQVWEPDSIRTMNSNPPLQFPPSCSTASFPSFFLPVFGATVGFPLKKTLTAGKLRKMRFIFLCPTCAANFGLP